MIKKENELTVDDLIVEYMIYKVQNGYEPSYSTKEFIEFLKFFESKMEVSDVLYDEKVLFSRFFERKSENDWVNVFDWNTKDKKTVPHMNAQTKDKETLISANYNLTSRDKNMLNTKIINAEENKKIQNIISAYLKDKPKRSLDISMEVNDQKKLMCKLVTADIVKKIWNCYTAKYINEQKWPKQCDDINKYMFDTDLAKIIGLESIQEDLIDLYKNISKRMAVLYKSDPVLKISSYDNKYLANSNYKLMIKGYEKLFDIAYGPNKHSINIDLNNFFQENICEIADLYNSETNDEHHRKRLVKNIEKKHNNF